MSEGVVLAAQLRAVLSPSGRTPAVCAVAQMPVCSPHRDQVETALHDSRLRVGEREVKRLEADLRGATAVTGGGGSIGLGGSAASSSSSSSASPSPSSASSRRRWSDVGLDVVSAKHRLGLGLQNPFGLRSLPAQLHTHDLPEHALDALPLPSSPTSVAAAVGAESTKAQAVRKATRPSVPFQAQLLSDTGTAAVEAELERYEAARRQEQALARRRERDLDALEKEKLRLQNLVRDMAENVRDAARSEAHLSNQAAQAKRAQQAADARSLYLESMLNSKRALEGALQQELSLIQQRQALTESERSDKELELARLATEHHALRRENRLVMETLAGQGKHVSGCRHHHQQASGSGSGERADAAADVASAPCLSHCVRDGPKHGHVPVSDGDEGSDGTDQTSILIHSDCSSMSSSDDERQVSPGEAHERRNERAPGRRQDRLDNAFVAEARASDVMGEHAVAAADAASAALREMDSFKAKAAEAIRAAGESAYLAHATGSAVEHAEADSGGWRRRARRHREPRSQSAQPGRGHRGNGGVVRVEHVGSSGSEPKTARQRPVSDSERHVAFSPITSATERTTEGEERPRDPHHLRPRASKSRSAQSQSHRHQHHPHRHASTRSGGRSSGHSRGNGLTRSSRTSSSSSSRRHRRRSDDEDAINDNSSRSDSAHTHHRSPRHSGRRHRSRCGSSSRRSSSRSESRHRDSYRVVQRTKEVTGRHEPVPAAFTPDCTCIDCKVNSAELSFAEKLRSITAQLPFSPASEAAGVRMAEEESTRAREGKKESNVAEGKRDQKTTARKHTERLEAKLSGRTGGSAERNRRKPELKPSSELISALVDRRLARALGVQLGLGDDDEEETLENELATLLAQDEESPGDRGQGYANPLTSLNRVPLRRHPRPSRQSVQTVQLHRELARAHTELDASHRSQNALLDSLLKMKHENVLAENLLGRFRKLGLSLRDQVQRRDAELERVRGLRQRIVDPRSGRGPDDGAVRSPQWSSARARRHMGRAAHVPVTASPSMDSYAELEAKRLKLRLLSEGKGPAHIRRVMEQVRRARLDAKQAEEEVEGAAGMRVDFDLDVREPGRRRPANSMLRGLRPGSGGRVTSGRKRRSRAEPDATAGVRKQLDKEMKDAGNEGEDKANEEKSGVGALPAPAVPTSYLPRVHIDLDSPV